MGNQNTVGQNLAAHRKYKREHFARGGFGGGGHFGGGGFSGNHGGFGDGGHFNHGGFRRGNDLYPNTDNTYVLPSSYASCDVPDQVYGNVTIPGEQICDCYSEYN